jgi:hypothetical protein
MSGKKRGIVVRLFPVSINISVSPSPCLGPRPVGCGTVRTTTAGDSAEPSTCSHTVDEGSASCSEDRTSILRVAGGFMDRPLTPGMSGGPLMVMQGFVVGISSARGCNSGIFVNLSGVDARLEEAERARAR